MIVGYGDRNVLLLGITDAEIEELRAGKTQTFEGCRMMTKDILLMWGRDKEHVLEQLIESGVMVSGQMADKYRKGERTDRPKKPA